MFTLLLRLTISAALALVALVGFFAHWHKSTSVSATLWLVLFVCLSVAFMPNDGDLKRLEEMRKQKDE